MADGRSYACSSFVNGGESACENSVRVRRDVLEEKLLGSLRDTLLTPHEMRRMGMELQKEFSKRAKDAAEPGRDVSRELAELNARIERLRHRQKIGDPGMTADELQAAITRAESKRRELEDLRIADDSAAIVSMLPRAAERCRQQVLAGWLEDKPEQAAKARVFLREYFRDVRLVRGKEPGSL
jgi:site-specific DNA recombinase